MLPVYTGDCVLPGQTLSLHVVEPRYLLMVRRDRLGMPFLRLLLISHQGSPHVYP